MSKKQITFGSALWGSTENLARRLLGLPPVATNRHTLRSWATTGIQRRAIAFLGLERGETLPKGWPVAVFECLDRYVQAKGGTMKVGESLSVPLLKLNRRSALVLPAMWIAYVDFESEGANFKALQASEEQLEDALARETGQMLNLRIMSKPARIEIDNPTPPVVKLADKWATLAGLEPLNYALGIESSPKGNYITTNRLNNANEFSAAYFGASGSGKTQAMMAGLLSVCATTSPADLSVVVVDPKAIDFAPFAGLPHLAHPIITDADAAGAAILAVVEEMDRRVAAGDTGAAQRRILLVVDELGDLLMQQKGDELEKALTRLGQKGRAWGFSMFLGSQRAVNESFPRSVQINLPAMIVGRVKSQGEAAFASGLPGCDAHKLPGKGAFMVYEPGADGVRVQSFFVADSNKPDYAKQVEWFVDDIRSRWAGIESHWYIGDQPRKRRGRVEAIALVDGKIAPRRTDPIASVGAIAGPQGGDMRMMVHEAVRATLLEMGTVREATEVPSESPGTLSDDARRTLDEMGDDLLDRLADAYHADPDGFNLSVFRRVAGRLASTKERRFMAAFLEWVQ